MTALTWWQSVSGSVFDGYQSGDWLVNYSGGFLRRGLFGQLLESTVPQDVSVFVALGIIQIVLLGMLYAIFAILFLRSDRSPSWFMVCLSPAVLIFPATNPEAAFRKEILALLALGFLALGVQKGIRSWHLIVALPVYTLALFSHEASIAVLPGFLFLIHNYCSGFRNLTARILNVYLISVSALVGLLSLLFRGSIEQSEAICRSWNARGIDMCSGGALSNMTISTRDSVDFLVSNYYPKYLFYLVVLAAALIPLFLVRFLPKYWKLGLAVVVFLIPLFLVAWDYGRWIYIGITQLSLIALALGSKDVLAKPKRVPLILALGYALLWGFAWYDEVWRAGLAVQLLQQLGIIH